MTNVDDPLTASAAASTSSNLKQSCRACLGFNDNSMIFNLQYENTCLSEIFELCTSIQINSDENDMPVYICQQCVKELLITFEFLRKCQAVDMKLKNNRAFKKFKAAVKVAKVQPLPVIKKGAEKVGPTSTGTKQNSSDCASLGEDDSSVKEPSKKDNENKNSKVSGNFNENRNSKVSGNFETNKDKEPSKNGELEERETNGEAILNSDTCDEEMKLVESETDTPAKDKKVFGCPLCQKEFLSESKLNDHVNIHTGIRPYPCTKCKKSFSQKTTLKMHLRYHDEGQNYSCTVCDELFLNKPDLTLHMKTHTEV